MGKLKDRLENEIAQMALLEALKRVLAPLPVESTTKGLPAQITDADDAFAGAILIRPAKRAAEAIGGCADEVPEQ
jgi:hypothetical protein